MSERPSVVRSYQRVFRPDRRIYAIDGRTLPIPGGLPLRWLAAASIAVLVVLLLSALSAAAILAAGAAAGVSMLRLGRVRLAPAAGVTASAACVVAGVLLGVMDWPLRLVVVPAVAATIATQPGPDGRPAHRFAWAWLFVWLAGRRRLGGALPAAGQRDGRRWAVRVVPDAHQPVLRRARITGPARLCFGEPVLVRRNGRRWLVRPLAARARRGGLMLDTLHVAAGERAEVRP